MDKIKISQDSIQILLKDMEESVYASEQNEEISKTLSKVADELKIVCDNLEKELSAFRI